MVTASTNFARLGSPLLRPQHPHLSLHHLCSSAVQQRRQRPMDQFHDRHHVWLRSLVHGTYLHADEDGHGVSLSSGRATMNAAWVVHLYGDDKHVLLHSAAYGRYLVATDASAPQGCCGFRVEQRNYDEELEEEAIKWQPHTNAAGDGILLRHAAAGSRYLRANGRHLRVSVDDFPSTMMRWVVVPIPSTELVPCLPRPNRFLLHLAESLSALLPTRMVEFIGNGNRFYANPALFDFRGRSVFRLMKEVARRMGIRRGVPDDLVMYVRAGEFGRFTPLVINLPRSSQTLVITVGPPAPDNVEPRYPDVGAE
ncbi:unnamed protein product [Alopecurus aequalis]